MTQALVLMTMALTVVDFAAFLGVLNVRRHLRGKRGYALTTIVSVVVGAVVIGDVMSAANSIGLFVVSERATSHDAPVLIYLLGSSLQTIAVLWAFYKVRSLSRAGRRYDDQSEPAEGEIE